MSKIIDQERIGLNSIFVVCECGCSILRIDAEQNILSVSLYVDLDLWDERSDFRFDLAPGEKIKLLEFAHQPREEKFNETFLFRGTEKAKLEFIFDDIPGGCFVHLEKKGKLAELYFTDSELEELCDELIKILE